MGVRLTRVTPVTHLNQGQYSQYQVWTNSNSVCICSCKDIPWMIFNEGMYLGFAFFLSWISECNLARILFAMAVPSIFWAVMTGLEVEKDALPR